MEVQVKKVSLRVLTPEYKSEGASGFDLHAFIDITMWLDPRDTALIPTGLSFAIPEGYELQIRTRSGLALNEGVIVLNSPGTVDSDYRGDVKVILMNLGPNKIKISPNDRIAQGVLTTVERANLRILDNNTELQETVRGDRGFGSTGL